jgi:alkyldihydroxyacetonephosphate synthase
MDAAVAHAGAVCLVPFGGGTSVSGALESPVGERRAIVSVSMQRMNRVLWIDRESMQACVEAGIIGTDLEREMAKHGLTVGHEPDSYEFSSLGGWVATRASGMKKNVYGNIEDIVMGITCVTPAGVLEHGSLVPRQSTGPDLLEVVLGSEGNLGVVTEVVLKVRKVPETRAFGSIVFPSFAVGVAFMREVAERRAQPASIRLVDNDQFIFGQALKGKPRSPTLAALKEAVGVAYLTRFKGFDPHAIAAVTLQFEGSHERVAAQQAEIFALARKHGGVSGGETNGLRGYFLTYMIAYVRDFAMKYGVLAESFETSVPWANVLSLCTDVKARVTEACARHGVRHPPLVSCRVTQTYDTGACVYFYFGFHYRGLADAEAVFEAVEKEARDEVLAHGGSLSHHHGVGKHRKQWMSTLVSPVWLHLLRATKTALDPLNVMGANNIIDFATPAAAAAAAAGAASTSSAATSLRAKL